MAGSGHSSDGSNKLEPAVFESVVQRAKRGDRAAQEEMLVGLLPYVRKMLFRLIGPAGPLDDLEQNVMIAVLTNLGSKRDDSLLTTWVGGICVNVARDHLRQRQKNARRMAPDAGEAAGSLTSDDNPEKVLAVRRRLETCQAILDTLSPDHRMALILKVVAGHTIEEVASIMKAARSTTRLRLYYARKAFARAIAGAVDAAEPPLDEEDDGDER